MRETSAQRGLDASLTTRFTVGQEFSLPKTRFTVGQERGLSGCPFSLFYTRKRPLGVAFFPVLYPEEGLPVCLSPCFYAGKRPPGVPFSLVYARMTVVLYPFQPHRGVLRWVKGSYPSLPEESRRKEKGLF